MSFEERWPTYLKQIKERMPAVLKEMLDAGVPIYYRDKNGRPVKAFAGVMNEVAFI